MSMDVLPRRGMSPLLIEDIDLRYECIRREGCKGTPLSSGRPQKNVRQEETVRAIKIVPHKLGQIYEVIHSEGLHLPDIHYIHSQKVPEIPKHCLTLLKDDPQGTEA